MDQENPNYEITRENESDQRAPLFDLPPGYRFKPTDEELIKEYLEKKVDNQPMPALQIPEVSIKLNSPMSLTEQYRETAEKEWYFFSPRDRKYPNGKRPDRASSKGFWKATGADKPIKLFEDEKTIIGYRKSLVYYQGTQRDNTKTDWIMHEYRLARPSKEIDPNDPDNYRLDNWVLCRIYINQSKPPCKKRRRKKEEASGSGTQRGDDVPTANNSCHDRVVINTMNIEDDLALNLGEELPEIPSSLMLDFAEHDDQLQNLQISNGFGHEEEGGDGLMHHDQHNAFGHRDQAMMMMNVIGDQHHQVNVFGHEQFGDHRGSMHHEVGAFGHEQVGDHGLMHHEENTFGHEQVGDPGLMHHEEDAFGHEQVGDRGLVHHEENAYGHEQVGDHRGSMHHQANAAFGHEQVGDQVNAFGHEQVGDHRGSMHHQANAAFGHEQVGDQVNAFGHEQVGDRGVVHRQVNAFGHEQVGDRGLVNHQANAFGDRGLVNHQGNAFGHEQVGDRGLVNHQGNAFGHEQVGDRGLGHHQANVFGHGQGGGGLLHAIVFTKYQNSNDFGFAGAV